MMLTIPGASAFIGLSSPGSDLVNPDDDRPTKAGNQILVSGSAATERTFSSVRSLYEKLAYL